MLLTVHVHMDTILLTKLVLSAVIPAVRLVMLQEIVSHAMTPMLYFLTASV
jgi:hypothetical protein